MPYPNEHSCRLEDPDQFERFARKNGEQEHDGKKIDVIYGIKNEKTQIQALRYPKGTWDEDAARNHCKGREGSFEAATKEAIGEMSAEDKRQLLQSSLETKFPQAEATLPSGVWVSDIYDAEFVFRKEGIDYKVSYSISEDGIVILGEPVKVRRQTVYTPMESLRQRYADIVQEVSKRNSLASSSRIKRVMELFQEVSTEPKAKDKILYALREADSTFLWLREQAVTKTEDGQDFPDTAYAYVPDGEKPSTWKLRLWEDPKNKVTRKQLGAASAALSPGGFRGQRVDIPKDDLPAVKRKIRAAYRSLDVPDEEIPRWVQESVDRISLITFIPLSESIDLGKGIAEVTVIKPGFNASKERYYPSEVLARDYKVFEGNKMYADHPSETDEKERPERSIKDWVATLKNVFVNEKGEIKGTAHIIETWMQQKLASLRDKGMLSEMGISINAVGTAIQGEIDGIKTNILERIIRGRSVDFVTEPGAGGLVEVYETDKDNDIDFISLITLKERRPDLVSQIELVSKIKITEEVKRRMEQDDRMQTLETENVALTKERDELKGKTETAERVSRIAATKAIVEKAIGEADLPEPAKARILEKFKDAESDEGLKETIQTEINYIASLTEAGKVKGLGGKKEDPETSRKALVESIKRLHPKYTDAQVEAFIEGR